MGTLTDLHIGCPAPILRYFLASLNQYGGGDYFLTASSASKSPRQRVLESLHRHAVSKDVTELTFTAEGTALHSAIADACGYTEDYDSGEWQYAGDPAHLEVTGEIETRLEAVIRGVTVSGQFDYYDTKHRILWDWKRASSWGKVFGTNWDEQHMFNRVLLAENDYEDPREFGNIAFYRDFMQSKAGDGKYPDYPLDRVMHKLPSLDECYAWVRERVRLHQEAAQLHDEGGKLPLCTDDERWAKFRKGKPPTYQKCERYCDAAAHCDQFKSEKGDW